MEAYKIISFPAKPLCSLVLFDGVPYVTLTKEGTAEKDLYLKFEKAYFIEFVMIG
jgi:hypothetical protein